MKKILVGSKINKDNSSRKAGYEFAKKIMKSHSSLMEGLKKR